MKNLYEFFKSYTESAPVRMEKLHKKGYSNGLIAMARAMAKKELIGVLTARSSYTAHASLIKNIERLTGSKIQYKYFVNDDSKFGRILDFAKSRGKDIKLSSDERKLIVLVEYRNGIFLSGKGLETKKTKFDHVKFYDDENKNLAALTKAKTILKKVGLTTEELRSITTNGIKAIQIKNFDYDKLDNLQEKLDRSLDFDKKAIHFFDLDGTVIHSNATINIVDDKGEILRKMSQEEFATQIDKILPKYKGQNISLDFGDFSKKERVDKYSGKLHIYKHRED